MATFLPGVTDTNLDPVLFTPDYSFLRYNLQKKSAQYEQGLKSVSSAYGALKKEMSDPANVERRDSYLKAAESELQKIASADLSLQQNVNAANAIFDPIATDPAIAYDMYHTGRIRKELAQMDSWAASDDMETRKKYNQQIYNWLRRDLDSLKNGNGDINNYKVQGRKAWAYVDGVDLVNQAAKDMGYKIENDELGKPYVVTTINGKTNRESYEQFAKGVLSSNPVYQQQAVILGEAKTEDDYEKAMADPQNAGLTREQAFANLAPKRWEEGKERQSQYISNLTERLSVKTAEYNAYLNQNAAAINADPNSEQAITAKQMAANLQQFKSDYDREKTNFSITFGDNEADSAEKKKQFVKSFIENPKAYYASQYMTEDIVKFSNIRSSFGSRSIKADQGYLGQLAATNRALNTMVNAADKQFDNEMDIAELGLKEAALALKGKAKDGTTKKNADGTDKQADIELTGTSVEQVNVTQKLNQLKEKVELTTVNAKNYMTSTYGGLYLLEKMGVSPSDVSLVRGYVSRSFDDPKTKITKDEGAALNRAYSTLFTWAKSSPTPNDELINTLRAAAQPGKTVKDLDFMTYLKMATKNYVTRDSKEIQAVNSLAMFENAMAEVSRLNGVINKGVEVVIEQISNNKELANDFKGLIVNEDGKKRLLEEKDIEKLFKSSTGPGGKPMPIDPVTRQQMVERYFNGTLDVFVQKPEGAAAAARTGGSTVGSTTIKLDGKQFYFLGDIFADVPTPEKYKKMMQRINERIPIPVFDNDTNALTVTGSPTYILRNQAKEDIRVKLSGITVENSNILMSDGSGKPDGYKDAPTKDQPEIRKALASKENVEEMKLYTNSPLNGGSQLVEVTMKTVSGDKAPSWSGQRYYFPINVKNSSNETFRVFSQADELDEFMAYSKQNKPYTIDHFEASGVKAEVIADQPGAKTGRVILKSKYDPVSKRYVDNWIENELTFDLTKMTFTEVKEEIYNKFITPYMQGYINYNRQAMNATGAPGSNLLQQLKGVVTWK